MNTAEHVAPEANLLLPVPFGVEEYEEHEADGPEFEPNSSDLVARINAGERDAITEFCRRYQAGIRFFILRYLGVQDVDDRVHDVIVAVIQAIRTGGIRHPDRLSAFVRAVAKNKIRTTIRALVRDRERRVQIESCDLRDGRLSPEQAASQNQIVSQIKVLLLGLPELDREILTRFYVKGQSKEQICGELGLTPTQFRLRKSRAKARIAKAMH